jgi:hypothetical protein
VVVDGFSRGGAGLPLEPGLAADQQAKVRRPSIATPPTNVTLADLQVGNFLESVTELKPGLKTPSAATRWHQLGDTKTFGRTQSVRLDTESYGSLVGTPSQEVWAEHTRSGRTKWDWVPMGDLRAGDRLWQAEAGAVRIQRSGRGKAAPSYVQLTLAGSEHTFCNRFLVHCQSRVIPAESRHGLLASTPVLLSAGKEGPQFRVLAEIDADFTARRFVPCIGFSDRTALVRRQKDLLIGVPRDETLY